MGWTRASELHRVLACPGSLLLPRSPDVPIEAGQWGRMVHTWKATGDVVPEPEYPNHGPLLADRLRRAAPDRHALWPAPGLHEVGLALVPGGPAEWFVGTPAEVEAWKAAHPVDWITGTADWISDVLDDPWIDDLKSGREPPPAHGPQNTFYSLAYARATGHRGRALSSITHWPRYPRDGRPSRTWATLFPEYLQLLEDDLRRLHDLVRGLGQRPGDPQSTPDRARARSLLPVLRPGPACTFCPSREYCPAHNLE